MLPYSMLLTFPEKLTTDFFVLQQLKWLPSDFFLLLQRFDLVEKVPLAVYRMLVKFTRFLFVFYFKFF